MKINLQQIQDMPVGSESLSFKEFLELAQNLLENHELDIDTLKERFDNFLESEATIEEVIEYFADAIDEAISDVNDRVDDAEDDISDNKSKVNNHETRISALENAPTPSLPSPTKEGTILQAKAKTQGGYEYKEQDILYNVNTDWPIFDFGFLPDHSIGTNQYNNWLTLEQWRNFRSNFSSVYSDEPNYKFWLLRKQPNQEWWTNITDNDTVFMTWRLMSADCETTLWNIGGLGNNFTNDEDEYGYMGYYS